MPVPTLTRGARSLVYAIAKSLDIENQADVEAEVCGAALPTLSIFIGFHVYVIYVLIQHF